MAKVKTKNKKPKIKINNHAPKSAKFRLIKSTSGITEYEHKRNGLRVLLSEDHSSPTVTLNVVYKVGSRNEAVGHTGATHLLEHLMFKGSKKFNKKTGKIIDKIIFGMGGMSNASTWFDRTNYFELIPRDRLPELMELEADRMRGAIISEPDRASEMTVVRNEFEWHENDPEHVLDKHVWATAFEEHPYHHPTIGWKSDVENMSIERLQAFYNEFYWPDNAVVTIVGDIETQKALRLVDKYFGGIKRSSISISTMHTVEPVQEGKRIIELRRSGELEIIMLGYKTATALHKDRAAIEVLTAVLGTGKTSRLYRRLVDGGLAKSVSVSNQAFRDGGLIEFRIYVTPGKTISEVEKIIEEEIKKIKEEHITKEEHKRVLYQTKVAINALRDGSYSLTSVLTECIASGDWSLIARYLPEIDKVTPEDVMRVAREYLIDTSLTAGHFIPKKSDQK